MKYYKKFYEIENNNYYTLNVDNETYLATESVLKAGKKKIFRKQEELTQGFKLLKFSTPIAILFNLLDNIPKISKQESVDESLIKYEIIKNTDLKKAITDAYDSAFKEARKSIDDWFLEVKHSLINKYTNTDGSFDKKNYEKEYKEFNKKYDEHVKVLNSNNPLNNDIDISNQEHTSCMIVKTMLREGLEHLYSERVTAFAKNIYLYEQDCFGTITIYRILTIKNVVKSIDSFVYDKKLVSTLLTKMYEDNK